MIAPLGWKLVPVEPTNGMVAGADKVIGSSNRLLAGDIYRAMIAAAPEPPPYEPSKAEVDALISRIGIDCGFSISQAKARAALIAADKARLEGK